MQSKKFLTGLKKQKQNKVNGMNAVDERPFIPIVPPSPGFSLNPRRASFSITANLFSSLPQKDSITGML